MQYRVRLRYLVKNVELKAKMAHKLQYVTTSVTLRFLTLICIRFWVKNICLAYVLHVLKKYIFFLKKHIKKLDIYIGV